MATAVEKAYADAPPKGFEEHYEGSCYIGKTWQIGDQNYFIVKDFSGALNGAVGVGDFECDDPTAAAPENVNATYKATYAGKSVEGRWVEYSLYITPPNATDGKTYDEYGRLYDYQHVKGKVRLHWNPNGKAKVKKASSNPSITDGNSCYSFKDAEFGIYGSEDDAKNKKSKKATLTTDANGESNEVELEPGDYWVREIKAPKSYQINDNPVKVTVTAGETTIAKISDNPLSDPDMMRVGKIDKDSLEYTGKITNLPEGSASLERAEFTFKFYEGYYGGKNADGSKQPNIPSKSDRTWVMKTDSDGEVYIQYGNSAKVSGDDFYKAANGKVTLPLGTITAIETKAPEGYLLGTPKLYISQIVVDKNSPTGTRIKPVNYEDNGTINTEYNTPITPEPVIRGGVKVAKKDREYDDFKNQGAATLEDAEFEIVNKSKDYVVVDGKKFQPGQVVKTLKTKWDASAKAFTAATESDALPYGDYLVYESKSSKGYLYDETSAAWKKEFKIEENGKVVDFTKKADACPNLVVRGDFSIIKVKASDQSPLANIPFEVTSDTTGESHVVVTDANGYLDTSADWNAHTAKTNANDKAVGSDGAVDDAKLDPTAGVWFTGAKDGDLKPDDARGALPYDTYTVSELRCKANENAVLRTIKVTITRDDVKLPAQTLEDPFLSIGTTLTSDTGSKIIPLNREVGLVDKVGYANLDAGKSYRLEGEIHKVGPDGKDMGAIASRSVTFTAQEVPAPVEVPFTVNTDGMKGCKLVAFEKLYDAHDALLVSHEDIDDEDQTVRVAELTTSLAGADGSKVVANIGAVKIVDTVTYSNLVPFRHYTLTGTLHARGEDGKDLGNVLEGTDAASVSVSFTPEAADGSVEVVFEADAGKLAGTLVAFEELRYAGEVISTHADIADEGQTVRVPGIKTTASDSETGSHAGSAEGHVIDSEALTGLAPGEKYTLVASLHERAADGTDAGEVKGADGKAVNATEKLVADKDAATVKVEFPALGGDAAGKAIVVYSQLFDAAGKLLAEEADIANDDQLVSYPAIATSAHAKDGQGHAIHAQQDAVVVDTVTYANVPEGTYTVEGALHALDEEGNDLGVFCRAKGDPVTATATFDVAAGEVASGSVDLEFTFDATNLQGKSFVAFEKLTFEGTVVAKHEDPSDEEQTVHVAGLETYAVDFATGEKTAKAKDGVAILDTATYTGLEPGRKYTIKGSVVEAASDKQVALAEEAVEEFTPESPSGKVQVKLALNDPEGPDGKTYTVYEEVYDADGNLVAEDRDNRSEAQSVAYRDKPRNAYAKTGASAGAAGAAGIAGIGLAALALAAFAARRIALANRRYWPVVPE